MLTKLKTKIKNFTRNIVYEGVSQYFNHVVLSQSSTPQQDAKVLNFDFTDVKYSILYENNYKPIISSDQKNDYYKKEHNLLDYHISFFNALTSAINLQGKRVLEIGGSNMPKELVIKDAGASKWVCIDKSWGYGFSAEHKNKIPVIKFGEMELKDALVDNDYVIYDGYAEQMTEDFYEQFDVCISNCCFEHVTQLPLVLDLIYYTLRPDGKLYASFSPIYSSSNGSHLWVVDKGQNIELTHANWPPELDWAHLYMGYAQIYEKLESLYGTDFAKKHTYKFKNGEHLNRLFFEDYVFIMHNSMFQMKSIHPLFCNNTIPEETMVLLRQMYPGYLRFDVSCILMQAYKNN